MLHIEVPDAVRLKLGKAIKKMRIDRGVSQAALADAAEISGSYLSQIERGTRSVSTLRLKVIAESLDSTLNGLLIYAKNGEEDPWLDILIQAVRLLEQLDLAQHSLQSDGVETTDVFASRK